MFKYTTKWLEAVQRASRTHGMSGTRVYRIWYNMRSRCNRPAHHNYRYYGGKGVKVCLEWEKFENFFKDMGLPPSDDHTLGRTDHQGNYELSNCKWVPWKIQREDQAKTRWIEYKGESHSLAEWGRKLGVNRTTLQGRLKRGLSFEDAVRYRKYQR